MVRRCVEAPDCGRTIGSISLRTLGFSLNREGGYVYSSDLSQEHLEQMHTLRWHERRAFNQLIIKVRFVHCITGFFIAAWKPWLIHIFLSSRRAVFYPILVSV